MQKTTKFAITLSIIFGIIIIIQSCKNSTAGETKISKFNETESHNMGMNCMQCHFSGGTGEGFFKIAGTVYDSLLTTTKPNGTISLFSGPNGTGTLITSVQVDGKGNFYTTNAVNFTGGLYPSIKGASGDTRFMGSKISSGDCNSCHGVTQARIWVK